MVARRRAGGQAAEQQEQRAEIDPWEELVLNAAVAIHEQRAITSIRPPRLSAHRHSQGEVAAVNAILDVDAGAGRAARQKPGNPRGHCASQGRMDRQGRTERRATSAAPLVRAAVVRLGKMTEVGKVGASISRGLSQPSQRSQPIFRAHIRAPAP